MSIHSSHCHFLIYRYYYSQYKLKLESTVVEANGCLAFQVFEWQRDIVDCRHPQLSEAIQYIACTSSYVGRFLWWCHAHSIHKAMHHQKGSFSLSFACYSVRSFCVRVSRKFNPPTKNSKCQMLSSSCRSRRSSHATKTHTRPERSVTLEGRESRRDDGQK